MIVEIVSGLIIAVTITVCSSVWKKAKQRRDSKRPVRIDVVELCDDGWDLAFTEVLPTLEEFDGKRIGSYEAYESFRAREGIDVGVTKLRITLQNEFEEPVLINSMRVVANRHSIPLMERLSCANAGANECKIFLIELDEKDPKVFEAEDRDFEVKAVNAKPFFDRNNVSLNLGEFQEIILYARAKEVLVEWKIEMKVKFNGKEIIQEIDSHGDFFKTVGEPPNGFARDFEWAWDLKCKIIPARNWDFDEGDAEDE